MGEPFVFQNASSLTRYTGYSVDNLRAMLRGLERVPGGSIFYHFHYALFRRHYAAGAFINDFSYWTWNVLHEEALSERLSILDPLEFPSVRAARNRLVEVVEDHLGHIEYIQHVPHDLRFHFLEAQSFVYGTGRTARDLGEFAREVRKVSPDVIFHHFIVAPLRLGPKENDFSKWIEKEWRQEELAQRLRELSPYSEDLFDLRQRIGELVELYV